MTEKNAPAGLHNAARHLEDFRLGERFATASVGVTLPDMRAFAEAFDPQPFHLDAEAAKRSVFGELVASGWYVVALTMRLLVACRPAGDTGLIGLGVEDLRFERPVRAGDTLTAEGEVVGLRPSRSMPGKGLVRVRIETRNQRRETVLRMTPTLLVPRAGA